MNKNVNKNAKIVVILSLKTYHTVLKSKRIKKNRIYQEIYSVGFKIIKINQLKLYSIMCQELSEEGK